MTRDRRNAEFIAGIAFLGTGVLAATFLIDSGFPGGGSALTLDGAWWAGLANILGAAYSAFFIAANRLAERWPRAIKPVFIATHDLAFVAMTIYSLAHIYNSGTYDLVDVSLLTVVVATATWVLSGRRLALFLSLTTILVVLFVVFEVRCNLTVAPAPVDWRSTVAPPLLLAVLLTPIILLTRRFRDQRESRIRARIDKRKQRERRYRTIADFTYDWETWENNEGDLTYVSPACERITGYLPEEFQSDQTLLNRIILKEDLPVWNRHLHSAPTSKQKSPVAFRIRHRDGTVRWIEHRCQPVIEEDGGSNGIRTSNRDITERHRVEERNMRLLAELGEVSRVASMGELAASIAHEINQPLSAIMNNANAAIRLAMKNDPDVDQIMDALGDIVSDNRRAAQVIRSLRSLFRKEDAVRMPVDMNVIAGGILEVARPEAERRNVELTSSLVPDLPAVSGDGVQIAHVLLNLVNNAFYELTRKKAGTRSVHVETGTTGSGDVAISVVDSGPGFPPEILSGSFGSFSSTRKGHLGIGLTLCRTIVQDHDGTISFDNAPSGGAVVTVTLPAVSEEYE